MEDEQREGVTGLMVKNGYLLSAVIVRVKTVIDSHGRKGGGQQGDSCGRVDDKGCRGWGHYYL